MKNANYAFALLTTLAAATPQWGGPGGPGNGNWGSGGPWAAFPSCANDCRNQNNVDWNNKDSLCNNNDVVNNLNNCINDSSCNDQDKNNVRQAIAQLCANAGATITAAPFASFSVTSGKSPLATDNWDSIGSNWAQWASSNYGGLASDWATKTSEWASWASAHGRPPSSAEWSAWVSSKGWDDNGPPHPNSALASEFSSWTAANTITAFPTNADQYSSFTSAHPIPSALSPYAAWASANGFPGGSAWPTAWTTNSAWASAVSNWNDGNSGNGGPPGWHGGAYGPFGHGGPGNGWGNGPWASSGAWTSGAWTQWWGTGACPASTWSGWTNGPWRTSAPWTSWTACTAETTASSVYTTTVTSNGNQITSVATSFGVRVAEATNDLTTSTGTETSGSGAKPTNFAMAGSAAGVLGVVAGALLL